MTELAPLLWPAVSVAVLMTVLLGTRTNSATNRDTATSWCIAGMLVIVWLGWLLSDARELLSATERLTGLDCGAWLILADFGLEDVTWRFQISPLAAWWMIGASGLTCLIGWIAHRRGDSLPLGWTGGMIGLTTGGVFFADDVFTAWILLSMQSLLCGFWLAWQARTVEAVSAVRRLGMTLLVSDTIGLIGVLLAGLACQTFDLTSLQDAEFLNRCWEERPAFCGLAGTSLFLALLGRCMLFPFCRGIHAVSEFRGPAIGLVFGVCLWPAALWFFLRLQPLLSLAPETVTVVQGLSLVGGVIGAFLAAAQTDRRRITALLVTSQCGLIMSAFVVRDVFSPLWLSLIVAELAVAMVTLFFLEDASEPSPGGSRLTVGLAFLIVAGCFPSPLFWMVGRSVDRFPAGEAADEYDEQQIELSQSAVRNPQTAIPHVLPAATWTAAWSFASFFATFAAWRGGRMPLKPSRIAGGGETNAVPHGGHSRNVGSSRSFALLLLLLLTMFFGIAGASWLAVRELDDVFAPDHWPLAAAMAASFAGLALSAWVCRDAELSEGRWRHLGSWTQLAEREFYLDVAYLVGIDLPVRAAAQLVRWFESMLINPSSGWVWNRFLRSLVSAVEELRNEPASFYAGAVLLTISVWLVTWLAVGG